MTVLPIVVVKSKNPYTVCVRKLPAGAGAGAGFSGLSIPPYTGPLAKTMQTEKQKKLHVYSLKM